MFDVFLKIQNIFQKYKNSRVAIEFSCPYIGEFLDVDRVIISRIDTDDANQKLYLNLFYEWHTEDAGSPNFDHYKDKRLYIEDVYKVYAKTIGIGKPFILHDYELETLSDEVVKSLGQNSDAKSIASVPIIVNNQPWGTLSIHNLHKNRMYKDDGTIEKLQIVANELSNYFNQLSNVTGQEQAWVEDHSIRMVALGRMAASVAHEINNPIFIIGGFATRIEQLLEEGEILESKDETHIALDMIQKNCKKVTNIIEGLRLMSRSTENDELEVADLNEIIKRTVDISKDRFQMEGIILKTNLLDTELLFECKPGQFSQILTNLLNNSFDSLKEKSKKTAEVEDQWVEVRTSLEGDDILLSVVDSGPRLSEEVVKNIMEPFFTTKDPGKGTGLGLSICKEIIKRYHGTIEVDLNCPNVKFDIRLPQISFDEEDENEDSED